MLRRSAAVEFASHCVPKAVVLTVQHAGRVWTETTSFPCAAGVLDLGERPWSRAFEVGAAWSPFFDLWRAVRLRPRAQGRHPCVGVCMCSAMQSIVMAESRPE
jgi:hypothetical protein